MNTSSHRNSLQPGHKISSYELIQVIGQGGFGITYLANDVYLNRKVAIKEYLPVEMAVREGDFTVHPVSDSHGDQFKWGLDRFLSEARTLAQFEHPNIVRVYAVFEQNNTGYMVMAYEAGESMQQKLAGKKTLDETDLLNILIPILDGLQLIHNAGFIHRDIKPDNIFIRTDGSPVLLDFGSARQTQKGDQAMTSLITPGYAPLEQYYSNSDQQGPWTDIYGLGATLYRAVTGKAPMNAMDRSQTILKTNEDKLITAMEISQGIYNDWFLNAIDHALQFREEDRPQSIPDWITEFQVPESLSNRTFSNNPAATIPVTEKITDFDSETATEVVNTPQKEESTAEISKTTKTGLLEMYKQISQTSGYRITMFSVVCIVAALVINNQAHKYYESAGDQAFLAKHKSEIETAYQASDYRQALFLLVTNGGQDLLQAYPSLTFITDDVYKNYSKLKGWFDKANEKGDKLARSMIKQSGETN